MIIGICIKSVWLKSAFRNQITELTNGKMP